MKFRVQSILIAMLAVLCVTEIYGQEMRTGSYNIRYDNLSDEKNGNGWARRCPVICRLIQFHDFDILGTQEVLYGQLQDMLRQLPGYSYIGVGRDDGSRSGEFAPIFYKNERYEVIGHGAFWLSEQTDRPNKGWDAALPRICTWGRFRDKFDGFTFWFFNLHMDHVGTAARKNSALLVLSKIREMCGTEPVLLTGDFNVDQTHDSYAVLQESGLLEDSYTRAGIVYATNGTINHFDLDKKTDSRIDHVFVSADFIVERYGILTDTYRSPVADSDKTLKTADSPQEISLYEYEARLPSDHFPVKVVLRYRTPLR